MSLLCLLLFCEAVGKGPPSISCHHAILYIYPVFLILATYHSHVARLWDYQNPLQYDLSYWYSNTRKLGSHLNYSKPPHFLPSNQPFTCIPHASYKQVHHGSTQTFESMATSCNGSTGRHTKSSFGANEARLTMDDLRKEWEFGGTMRSGNFCLGSFWEMLDGYEGRWL